MTNTNEKLKKCLVISSTKSNNRQDANIFRHNFGGVRQLILPIMVSLFLCEQTIKFDLLVGESVRRQNDELTKWPGTESDKTPYD